MCVLVLTVCVSMTHAWDGVVGVCDSKLGVCADAAGVVGLRRGVVVARFSTVGVCVTVHSVQRDRTVRALIRAYALMG